MEQLIGSAVRHGLTTIGGYLVASGHLQASDVQLLVGAGVAIVGVGFSVWEKRQRK